VNIKHSDWLRCPMRGRSIFAKLSSEDICQFGMDVHYWLAGALAR
jgi:hypothetical protein